MRIIFFVLGLHLALAGSKILRLLSIFIGLSMPNLSMELIGYVMEKLPLTLKINMNTPLVFQG